MGSRTTVDFVGATSVSVLTEGSDSYRCTMTVTVANFPALCVPSQPGGNVEKEIKHLRRGAKAWFDLRVMVNWIENSWKPNATFKGHKMAEVVDALACTGTLVLFVPGGCTGAAQPLDVDVMAPLKQHICKCYSNRPSGKPRKITPVEHDLKKTVSKVFHKAGPFVR
ncbi:DDE superfamily endonuclease domain [Phytophthora cactorum]|nr:DDE superfamily endonuclease domain [Phytophthora cactorum]